MQKKEKIDILLKCLDERYHAIHTIRERLQNTSIRILWILFWCSWFLFHANMYICRFEKILILLVIRISFYILQKYYIEDLKKWFNTQRKVAAEIEKSLWLYTPWEFLNDKKTIYPKERYECKEWFFFRNNSIIIALWFILLSLSIILYT